MTKYAISAQCKVQSHFSFQIRCPTPPHFQLSLGLGLIYGVLFSKQTSLCSWSLGGEEEKELKTETQSFFSLFIPVLLGKILMPGTWCSSVGDIHDIYSPHMISHNAEKNQISAKDFDQFWNGQQYKISCKTCHVDFTMNFNTQMTNDNGVYANLGGNRNSHALLVASVRARKRRSACKIWSLQWLGGNTEVPFPNEVVQKNDKKNLPPPSQCTFSLTPFHASERRDKQFPELEIISFFPPPTTRNELCPLIKNSPADINVFLLSVARNASAGLHLSSPLINATPFGRNHYSRSCWNKTVDEFIACATLATRYK